MPNNIAQLLYWAGISPLGLDPSHVSMWSRISAIRNIYSHNRILFLLNCNTYFLSSFNNIVTGKY